MKSIVIRKRDDFDKITDDTELIELVDYNGVFSFDENYILPGITFTRMNVYLEKLPVSIKRLSLYNCQFEEKYLERFDNVEELDITNSHIDIKSIKKLNIRELGLDYSNVSNCEEISCFNNLEKISLYKANVDDLDFLFKLSKLKVVCVDDKNYEDNIELFKELSKKDVLITDMMGGVFNEV